MVVKDNILFQVVIEVHGKAYTITKEAPSYIDLVYRINNEFGHVLILETINLN